MSNRPQRVLLSFALFLIACGIAGFALAGFDTSAHFHGVRFAMLVAICALIAGRLKRQRVFALMAIDFCSLLLLALAANYFRLTLKWHGMEGRDWYLPYLAAAMGLGSFLTLGVLLFVRPRRQGSDWWRWSPLLCLPLVVSGFSRRRHGLTLGRRALIALGLGLLTCGFVLSNGSRLSNTSVASVIGSAQLMRQHEEVLRQILSDPQQIEQMIEDPRARSWIGRISADVGISDEAIVHSALDSAVEGDVSSALAALAEEGVSAADVAEAVASAVQEQRESDADAFAEEMAASLASSNQGSGESEQVIHDQMDALSAEAAQRAPGLMPSMSQREMAEAMASRSGSTGSNDPGIELEEARALARHLPPGAQQADDDVRRSRLIDDLKMQTEVEPLTLTRSTPAHVLPVASDGSFVHEHSERGAPWPQRRPPRGWTPPQEESPENHHAAEAAAAEAQEGVSVVAPTAEAASPADDAASAASFSDPDEPHAVRESNAAAAGVAPDAGPAASPIDREVLSALVSDAAESLSRADHDLSVARAKLIGRYGGLGLMLLGVTLVSTALAKRTPGNASRGSAADA